MNMFCLGFGNDVDYSFLDVMSRQNKGVARRIFEGSDAAVQLQVHWMQALCMFGDFLLWLCVCTFEDIQNEAMHDLECVFVAGFL